MAMKIDTWLTQAAIQTPNKPAFITENGTFTYQWIESQSNRLATALVSQYGICPGDRIAMVLPNNIYFIIAYYAILKADGVCVPIHHLSKRKEIIHVLNHSEARLLLADKTLLNEEEFDAGECPFLQYLCVSASEDGMFKPFMMFRIANAPEATKLPESRSEIDEALIFYTSGTSGAPKGVILTHENVFSKMNPIKQAIKFSSEDRLLSGLPLVYVYGQIMALNFTIWCRATLILLQEETVSRYKWGIEQQGATVIMSTPSIYYQLNQYCKATNTKMNHNLRYAITGGSLSSILLKKEFERVFQVELLDCYGLTETSSSIIMEHPGVYNRKLGSIGRALANHDVKILDEEGEELPPGQVGEIALRSKTVMKQYFKNELLQVQKVKNGWFLTGDLGYQDIGGNFFLVDRRNDIIQTMGFAVSPSEIEEVLLEHPKIQETAVVGILDETKGEVIKAYIIVKPEENLNEQNVKEFLEERLAFFKCPTVIEFVDSLPRNISGKLLRRLLKNVGCFPKYL